MILLRAVGCIGLFSVGVLMGCGGGDDGDGAGNASGGGGTSGGGTSSGGASSGGASSGGTSSGGTSSGGTSSGGTSSGGTSSGGASSGGGTSGAAGSGSTGSGGSGNGGSGGSSPGTIYFSADHENPGPPGAQYYNYASKFAQGPWSWTHLPTGGWAGSGGAHIRMHAGQTQYTFGFVTPSLNHQFQMGDGVYLRFRIRWDSDMLASTDWGNKFILMGQTGTTPNSRIIVYMNPPNDSRGCTLGFSHNGVSPPWALPNHYGINGTSFFSLSQVAWSLAPHVNIGWDCGPPVFQTIPSNPLDGRPGPTNSAKAIDGWNHIQIYAQSGPAGQGIFRTWANNDNQSSPSSERIGFTDGLGVTGWGNGATVGGYMDNDTPTSDLGYVIDDFQIGDSFDPNWYP